MTVSNGRFAYGFGILGSAIAAVLIIGFAAFAHADQSSGKGKGPSLMSPNAPGLAIPLMNARRGRRLFAEKGCIVCHSVNRVGGGSARNLDYPSSFPYASPFDFAARMWRGAKAMIALQEKDLGYTIDLTGNDMADISAFAHSPKEQRKFSESDIPHRIKQLMKLRGL